MTWEPLCCRRRRAWSWWRGCSSIMLWDPVSLPVPREQSSLYGPIEVLHCGLPGKEHLKILREGHIYFKSFRLLVVNEQDCLVHFWSEANFHKPLFFFTEMKPLKKLSSNIRLHCHLVNNCYWEALSVIVMYLPQWSFSCLTEDEPTCPWSHHPRQLGYRRMLLEWMLYRAILCIKPS